MTMHWSQINYSAIVKILKKHDKRTGVLLRAPYLANVLHQVRRGGERRGQYMSIPAICPYIDMHVPQASKQCLCMLA